MKQFHVVLLASLLALAACGTTKEDRALSGGLIGAGAGAVVGSTVGAPVTGAAIGAGVGATTGALTDPENINIGKPFWKK
ncbi:MAG: YMGG-like glycine zipper-containing protein [Alphaproteobacteria bacterium]|nr:YMGG-like glycine zipper-containing protein [Alphaproteobacteria bacterium]